VNPSERSEARAPSPTRTSNWCRPWRIKRLWESPTPRAYDELQVSNVQVLRHEKLVAMGRLTSGLAHELRNPLQNVVALTSELVERSRGSLREHPEFVDFPEYLRRAHGEAKRAADIVDRLLDHIRERTPTFDRVDG
jgi:two-component system, NtrC family, sensor kinase